MPRVTPPDILPVDCSAGSLAGLIGVTERTITGRRSDGRLPALANGRLDFRAIVKAGVDALAAEQRQAGRASDDLDLNAERARLAKEQADAAAMRNAVSRAELLPAGEVVEAMRQAFGACRARLLAIPAKAAPLVAGMQSRAEVRDILTNAVYEACDELSDARVEAALAERPGGGGGDPDSDGGMEGAAETDSKRLGGYRADAVSRGKRRAGAMDDGEG